MNNRRRALLGVESGSILPPEYQQVEYLESTGTQYILTNITISNNTIWEMSVDISNTTVGGFGISATNLSTTAYCIFYFPVGSGLIIYIDGSIRDNISNIRIPNAQNYVFYNRVNNTYGCNTYSNSFTPKSIMSDQVLTMFAWREGGVNYYLCHGKLYWLKWYDGTSLLYDFIPCYRKSDNEPGMYDLINNVFYTNNGTGTFIVGNDVN